MEQVIVYTERQSNTPHTNEKSAVARAPSRSAGLSDAPEGQTMRQFSFASIYPIPENLASDCSNDPQPNFDAPRLIERADALCYSLPMTAPDGSRCHVVLVGSFAAWGALMTALVREGFAHAEPGRKFEPGAWKDGGAL